MNKGPGPKKKVYTDKGSYKEANKAYQDSSRLYNQGQEYAKHILRENKSYKKKSIDNSEKAEILKTNLKERSKTQGYTPDPNMYTKGRALVYEPGNLNENNEFSKGTNPDKFPREYKSTKIAPTGKINGQPVLYDKPKVKPVYEQQKYSKGTSMITLGPGKGKSKGKGDLSPKKRKVVYKDQTEKAVIGLMKDANEGRRDYVEIRDKSSKVVADKFEKGGTVKNKDKYFYDEVNPDTGEVTKGDRLKKNFLMTTVNVSKKKQQAYENEKNSAKIGKLDDSLNASKIDLSKKIKHDDLFVGPPEAETKVDYNPGPGKVDLPKVKKEMTEEQKKVAAWQSRRGLKADGVWGKNTQAQYEKEQAAKKKTISVGKSKESEALKEGKEYADIDFKNHAQGLTKDKVTPKGGLTDGRFTVYSNGRVYDRKTGRKGYNGGAAYEWDKPSKESTTRKPPKVIIDTTSPKYKEAQDKYSSLEKESMSNVKNSIRSKEIANQQKVALKKRYPRGVPESKSPLTRLDESIMGDKYYRDSEGRLRDKKTKQRVGSAK